MTLREEWNEQIKNRNNIYIYIWSRKSRKETFKIIN